MREAFFLCRCFPPLCVFAFFPFDATLFPVHSVSCHVGDVCTIVSCNAWESGTDVFPFLYVCQCVVDTLWSLDCTHSRF